MKKYLMVMVILIVLTSLLTSCSYIFKPEDLMSEQVQQEGEKHQEQQEIDASPTYGGSIQLPMLDSSSLNPLLLDTKSSYNVLSLVYDNFIEYDSQFRLQPAIAQSWQFSEDGKEVIFHIRKDVKWHDGEYLTADDVKFTLDMILNEQLDSPYKYQLTPYIKSYKVENQNSIKILFNKAVGGMLGILAIPIIPAHYYKSADFILENKLIQPVGTGAYKVVEYQKRNNMLLKCNDEWWKQKPYIQDIKVKLVPNMQAELAAFEADLVDMCCADTVDADKYAQFADTSVYQVNTQDYEFIALNHKKNIFQDKSVRKAIAWAINKKDIIEDILLGHALSTSVPVHPESWLYDESFDMYSFNQNKARDILANAGWTDPDGDGILTKTIDGKQTKLEFELLTNYENEIRKSVAGKIADDLKKIGIQVNLKYFNWEEDESEGQLEIQKIIDKGDFDALLTGYNLSRVPDLAFAFHSDFIENGQNFVSYSNEKIDQMLDSIGQFVQDEQFKEAFVEMMQIIADDLPYISLYFRTSSVIASQKIKDMHVYSEDDLYRYLYKWYIFDQ